MVTCVLLGFNGLIFQLIKRVALSTKQGNLFCSPPPKVIWLFSYLVIFLFLEVGGGVICLLLYYNTNLFVILEFW